MDTAMVSRLEGAEFESRQNIIFHHSPEKVLQQHGWTERDNLLGLVGNSAQTTGLGLLPLALYKLCVWSDKFHTKISNKCYNNLTKICSVGISEPTPIHGDDELNQPGRAEPLHG